MTVHKFQKNHLGYFKHKKPVSQPFNSNMVQALHKLTPALKVTKAHEIEDKQMMRSTFNRTVWSSKDKRSMSQGNTLSSMSKTMTIFMWIFLNWWWWLLLILKSDRTLIPVCSSPHTPSFLNHMVVQVVCFQIRSIHTIPERWLSSSWLIYQQLKIYHPYRNSFFCILHPSKRLNCIAELLFLNSLWFCVDSLVRYWASSPERR